MLEMLTKKMESVDTQLVALATTPGAVAGSTPDEQIKPSRQELDKSESKVEKVSSENENIDFLKGLEVEQVSKRLR